MNDLFQSSSASVSPCGRYRYGLTRQWSDGLMMGFVMLNPSTADADLDDPTIRRCIGFARREGCGGIVVVNLFPLRATDPAQLWATRYLERFGPDSDNEFQRHLRMMTGPIVAAWGADGDSQGGDAVALMRHYLGSRLVCLGKTQQGAPRHPLYVRGDAPLIPFSFTTKAKGGDHV
ncbi:DUF1643 domain-containing protein [Shinella zoogloeoides]|uniref:DUF1643 domain-containing protein n=1 Tax=Shinella zoogloeoides TaxID=352475 RepID=UPI00299D00F9|nr:DUF1643 domain-containing protein [Shinella zoogloeoides]WPE19847.1 hypothetical protein ShzoTeo12_10230 [Shinella zoogloeoides]